MPSIISGNNSARNALPDKIRQILDMIMPVDDIMPTAGSVVTKAPGTLSKALGPLLDSLKVGKRVAPQVVDPRPASKAVETFSEHLNNQTFEPPSIERMLSASRVTGARPHPRTVLQLPEGFKLQPDWGVTDPDAVRQRLRLRGSPKTEALDKIWRSFYANQPQKSDLKPLSSHSPEKPVLSRRQTSGNLGPATGRLKRPKIEVTPDLIEQIQRAAPKHNTKELSNIFNLSQTRIQQILQMPWKWGTK